MFVVDCDLRKPTIHKKFAISNQKGLSEIIIGKYSKIEEIKKYAQKYNDNLDIIPAGKTKKDSVLAAKKALEKVNAKIIGTVLNGVEQSKEKYYYYYG